MGSLVYIRLIGYTAGTLLQLFWMVVILGYRRQRNFERVFFFLCLALFLFYGGSLLALNAQIYYAAPPAVLTAFAWTALCAGLCFLPALLVHLHLEYAETRELLQGRIAKRLWLTAVYAPALLFALRAYPLLSSPNGVNFVSPANSLGRVYGVWMVLALIVCADWERRFGVIAPDFAQELFHRIMAGCFGVAAIGVLTLHVVHPRNANESFSTALAYVPIVPLVVLIYYVQKHNFLQIGRQRNLVYAVTVTFLALLYLSLIRRVSIWMEPTIPPEATASILVFLLVVFFEPLQRWIGRRLHETAHTELDRSQKMTSAIQQVARLGNSAKLKEFIERWVKEQIELADARLILQEGGETSSLQDSGAESENSFEIQQGGRRLGRLEVKPHGAMLSGDTRAALEFLCEQLPGALDLCRLIEEKLRLERELAERERLALVGQMAASISHNLKNPLGSIKTILQVQLENPELPESIRGETKMVLEEIGRLSTKLNQLLQFSRPAVRGGSAIGSCDVRVVIEEVTSVLSHEAERRGVRLQTEASGDGVRVAVSAEALNDVVSNLVVNALEAAPRGGRVTVGALASEGTCVLMVEDDGPGIPAAVQEKILQPFFTTKPQGTGLGLAIVARRVAEFGGKVEWESPVRDGKGTRFRVILPLAG